MYGEVIEMQRPTQAEVELAKESLKPLSRVSTMFKKTQDVPVHISNEEDVTFIVPRRVFELLASILHLVSEKKHFSLIPADAELTTQEAANMLNVSRPYLVQLLEKGEIGFRKVGAHRRIRFEDIMAYREMMASRKQRALEELARQAQELKLGYDL